MLSFQAAYAKMLRKVLEKKEVRESFLMLVPADVLSAEAEKQHKGNNRVQTQDAQNSSTPASNAKASTSKGGAEAEDDEDEDELPPEKQ